MSATVTPISFDAECIRGNVTWAEGLARDLADNRIAAITCVGVDKDGETFSFRIVPVNAPTLRYIQKGQLLEAIEDLNRSLDEETA